MKHEWNLKRNCSLSPRQVGIAYGLLCTGVIGVGVVFAMHGIWFVLAFALLEIGGIALALLHYARHATDHEHVALSEECLLIERVEAGQREQIRLETCWTRIALPDRRRPLIALESRGVKVELGTFVSEETREAVANELQRELRGNSYLA
ncbi:MAG: DUF2244 domain-containing protein [Massilia sp.]